MFCPNCGSEIVDGAYFCAGCGTNISSPEVATPQAIPYQKKFSKGKYIKKLASKKVKVLAGITWAILLVCVIVLGSSAYAVIKSSVFDIPVVNMIVPENDKSAATKELNQIVNILDEHNIDTDEVLDKAKKELSKKEYELLVKTFNNIENFAQDPSINNTKAILNNFTEIADAVNKYDVEILNELDTADLLNTIEQPIKIIDIIIYVIYGFAALIGLILLLATVFKKTGLVIFALILALPFCYFFAGVIYTVLTAVFFIALMILFIIINKEYKAYKKAI